MTDILPPVDMQLWALPLAKVQGFAEQQGAKIVGITGDRSGVGVSLLSCEVARLYTEIGKPTLLVDASHLEIEKIAGADDPGVPFDLLAKARSSNTGLWTIDLAEFAHQLPTGRTSFRRLFETAAGAGMTVIVDLPPAGVPSGQAMRTFAVAGAACDLVFLVCLSGVIKKAELSNCVDLFKIKGVTLGGIIQNDWKLPVARLLEAFE